MCYLAKSASDVSHLIWVILAEEMGKSAVNSSIWNIQKKGVSLRRLTFDPSWVNRAAVCTYSPRIFWVVNCRGIRPPYKVSCSCPGKNFLLLCCWKCLPWFMIQLALRKIRPYLFPLLSSLLFFLIIWMTSSSRIGRDEKRQRNEVWRENVSLTSAVQALCSATTWGNRS